MTFQQLYLARMRAESQMRIEIKKRRPIPDALYALIFGIGLSAVLVLAIYIAELVLS